METDFTKLNVQTLVEYFVHGEAPLEEGFVDQLFTGMDDDAKAKIEKNLADGIKSESDRKRILNKLDDMIDDSNRQWTFSNFKSALLSVLPLGAIIYLISRLSNKSDAKEFRETLYDLRSLVKAAKLSK